MKLWIDQDLSPSLVEVCRDAGHHATSVRDRGKLSTKDHALAEIVLDEGWILVTNDAGDFLKLAERVELHPGLVFIELGSAQIERDWLAVAIAHIERRAADAEEPAEQFIVGRVVEVTSSGACTGLRVAVVESQTSRALPRNRGRAGRCRIVFRPPTPLPPE